MIASAFKSSREMVSFTPFSSSFRRFCFLPSPAFRRLQKYADRHPSPCFFSSSSSSTSPPTNNTNTTEPQTNWFSRSASSPPRLNTSAILSGGFNASIGIGALCGISALCGAAASSIPFALIGSFGASSALVYGAPELPVSQPRNVIGGHMVSAAVGVLCATVLAPVSMPLALSVSVGGSIIAMFATKTFHPPAAGNGIIFLTGATAIQELGWLYVLSPCGFGASVIVAWGLIGNNVLRPGGNRRLYPTYWW